MSVSKDKETYEAAKKTAEFQEAAKKVEEAAKSFYTVGSDGMRYTGAEAIARREIQTTVLDAVEAWELEGKQDLKLIRRYDPKRKASFYVLSPKDPTLVSLKAKEAQNPAWGDLRRAYETAVTFLADPLQTFRHISNPIVTPTSIRPYVTLGINTMVLWPGRANAAGMVAGGLLGGISGAGMGAQQGEGGASSLVGGLVGTAAGIAGGGLLGRYLMRAVEAPTAPIAFGYGARAATMAGLGLFYGWTAIDPYDSAADAAVKLLGGLAAGGLIGANAGLLGKWGYMIALKSAEGFSKIRESNLDKIGKILAQYGVPEAEIGKWRTQEVTLTKLVNKYNLPSTAVSEINKLVEAVNQASAKYNFVREHIGVNIDPAEWAGVQRGLLRVYGGKQLISIVETLATAFSPLWDKIVTHPLISTWKMVWQRDPYLRAIANVLNNEVVYRLAEADAARIQAAQRVSKAFADVYKVLKERGVDVDSQRLYEYLVTITELNSKGIPPNPEEVIRITDERIRSGGDVEPPPADDIPQPTPEQAQALLQEAELMQRAEHIYEEGLKTGKTPDQIVEDVIVSELPSDRPVTPAELSELYGLPPAELNDLITRLSQSNQVAVAPDGTIQKVPVEQPPLEQVIKEHAGTGTITTVLDDTPLTIRGWDPDGWVDLEDGTTVADVMVKEVRDANGNVVWRAPELTEERPPASPEGTTAEAPQEALPAPQEAPAAEPPVRETEELPVTPPEEAHIEAAPETTPPLEPEVERPPEEPSPEPIHAEAQPSAPEEATTEEASRLAEETQKVVSSTGAKLGSESYIVIGNRQVPVRYALIESEQALASHSRLNPDGTLEILDQAGKGYPTIELPDGRIVNANATRDYSRDYTFLATLDNAFANPIGTPGAFDPNRLLTIGVTPAEGPSMVSEVDGQLIRVGGNRRGIFIQRAYSAGFEPYGEAYKAQLARVAEQFGFRPEDVLSMRHPELVRIVAAPEGKGALAKFIVDLNSVTTMGADTTTSFQLRLMGLQPHQLDRIYEALEDLPEEGALGTILQQPHAAVRKLIAALRESGVIPDTELPRVIVPQGTHFTPQGASDIRSVIEALTIPDPTVRAILSERPQLSNLVIRSSRDLVAISRHDPSFAEHFREAILLNDKWLKEREIFASPPHPYESWKRTADLFGGSPYERATPEAQILTDYIERTRTKPKEFQRGIHEYANYLRKTAGERILEEAGQTSLFEMPETRSPEEAFRSAFLPKGAPTEEGRLFTKLAPNRARQTLQENLRHIIFTPAPDMPNLSGGRLEYMRALRDAVLNKWILPNMDTEQALRALDDFFSVSDAMASAAMRYNPERFRTLDDWYRLRTVEIVDQLLEGRATGAVTFTPNVILSYVKGETDLNTLIHEEGHILFEELLTPTEIEIVAREYGFTDLPRKPDVGLIDRNSEAYRVVSERFAEDFERFVYEARTPSEDMRPILTRLKDFLSDVYHMARDFVNRALGRGEEAPFFGFSDIPPEIRQIYEKYTSPYTSNAVASKIDQIYKDYISPQIAPAAGSFLSKSRDILSGTSLTNSLHQFLMKSFLAAFEWDVPTARKVGRILDIESFSRERIMLGRSVSISEGKRFSAALADSKKRQKLIDALEEMAKKYTDISEGNVYFAPVGKFVDYLVDCLNLSFGTSAIKEQPFFNAYKALARRILRIPEYEKVIEVGRVKDKEYLKPKNRVTNVHPKLSLRDHISLLLDFYNLISSNTVPLYSYLSDFNVPAAEYIVHTYALQHGITPFEAANRFLRYSRRGLPEEDLEWLREVAVRIGGADVFYLLSGDSSVIPYLDKPWTLSETEVLEKVLHAEETGTPLELNVYRGAIPASPGTYNVVYTTTHPGIASSYAYTSRQGGPERVVHRLQVTLNKPYVRRYVVDDWLAKAIAWVEAYTQGKGVDVELSVGKRGYSYAEARPLPYAEWAIGVLDDIRKEISRNIDRKKPELMDLERNDLDVMENAFKRSYTKWFKNNFMESTAEPQSFYEIVHRYYGLNPEQIERIAEKHAPKLNLGRGGVTQRVIDEVTTTFFSLLLHEGNYQDATKNMYPGMPASEFIGKLITMAVSNDWNDVVKLPSLHSSDYVFTSFFMPDIMDMFKYASRTGNGVEIDYMPRLFHDEAFALYNPPRDEVEALSKYGYDGIVEPNMTGQHYQPRTIVMVFYDQNPSAIKYAGITWPFSRVVEMLDEDLPIPESVYWDYARYVSDPSDKILLHHRLFPEEEYRTKFSSIPARWREFMERMETGQFDFVRTYYKRKTAEETQETIRGLMEEARKVREDPQGPKNMPLPVLLERLLKSHIRHEAAMHAGFVDEPIHAAFGKDWIGTTLQEDGIVFGFPELIETARRELGDDSPALLLYTALAQEMKGGLHHLYLNEVLHGLNTIEHKTVFTDYVPHLLTPFARDQLVVKGLIDRQHAVGDIVTTRMPSTWFRDTRLNYGWVPEQWVETHPDTGEKRIKGWSLGAFRPLNDTDIRILRENGKTNRLSVKALLKADEDEIRKVLGITLPTSKAQMMEDGSYWSPRFSDLTAHGGDLQHGVELGYFVEIPRGMLPLVAQNQLYQSGTLRYTNWSDVAKQLLEKKVSELTDDDIKALYTQAKVELLGSQYGEALYRTDLAEILAQRIWSSKRAVSFADVLDFVMTHPHYSYPPLVLRSPDEFIPTMKRLTGKEEVDIRKEYVLAHAGGGWYFVVARPIPTNKPAEGVYRLEDFLTPIDLKPLLEKLRSEYQPIFTGNPEDIGGAIFDAETDQVMELNRVLGERFGLRLSDLLKDGGLDWRYLRGDYTLWGHSLVHVKRDANGVLRIVKHWTNERAGLTKDNRLTYHVQDTMSFRRIEAILNAALEGKATEEEIAGAERALIRRTAAVADPRVAILLQHAQSLYQPKLNRYRGLFHEFNYHRLRLMHEEGMSYKDAWKGAIETMEQSHPAETEALWHLLPVYAGATAGAIAGGIAGAQEPGDVGSKILTGLAGAARGALLGGGVTALVSEAVRGLRGSEFSIVAEAGAQVQAALEWLSSLFARYTIAGYPGARVRDLLGNWLNMTMRGWKFFDPDNSLDEAVLILSGADIPVEIGGRVYGREELFRELVNYGIPNGVPGTDILSEDAVRLYAKEALNLDPHSFAIETLFGAVKDPETGKWRYRGMTKQTAMFYRHVLIPSAVGAFAGSLFAEGPSGDPSYRLKAAAMGAALGAGLGIPFGLSRLAARGGNRFSPAALAYEQAAEKAGVAGKLLKNYGGKESGFTYWVRRSAAFAEDVQRVAFYLYLRKKGFLPSDAARYVHESLFSAASRSTVASYLRPFMPFARWTAFNLPLQWKSLIETPRFFFRLGKGVTVFSADGEPVDQRWVASWIKGQPHILYLYDPENQMGKYFVLNSWIPQADLFQVLDTSRWQESVWSLLTPVVTQGFEQMFNKRLFFDASIDPGAEARGMANYETEKFLGVNVYRRVSTALGTFFRLLREIDRISDGDPFRFLQSKAEREYNASLREELGLEQYTPKLFITLLSTSALGFAPRTYVVHYDKTQRAVVRWLREHRPLVTLGARGSLYKQDRVTRQTQYEKALDQYLYGNIPRVDLPPYLAGDIGMALEILQLRERLREEATSLP
jgi:hypothetical protein